MSLKRRQREMRKLVWEKLCLDYPFKPGDYIRLKRDPEVRGQVIVVEHVPVVLQGRFDLSQARFKAHVQLHGWDRSDGRPWFDTSVIEFDPLYQLAHEAGDEP